MNKFFLPIIALSFTLFVSTACGNSSNEKSSKPTTSVKTKSPASPVTSRSEVGAKGKKLYKIKLCGSCHGLDGTLGLSDAKNLKESVMTDEEIRGIIKNGKGVMPPVPNLSDDEMDALVEFVLSLRK